MKLNVAELRRFFGSSSTIKSNGVLPVLDYIFVDKNRIVKTNLNAWVVMTITPVKESMLLDERVLSGLVKVTTADSIEVEVKGNVVHLTDGKHKARFSWSNDVDLYPKFPDSEKENEVRLGEEVLKAIGVGVKNIASATSGIVNPVDYVHLSKDYVFASDGNRFYTRKFDSLPTISIDNVAANIVSQYGAATYYSRDNFDFFEIGSFLFGFKKPEITIPNFEVYMKVLGAKEYMEFDVSDVLSFLSFLSDQTQSATVVVNIQDKKLSFFDEDIQVGDEVVLEVDGDFKPNVMLLPRLLAPFLKSFGKERLRMSPLLEDKKGMHFWDDGDISFHAVLAEASKETTN